MTTARPLCQKTSEREASREDTFKIPNDEFHSPIVLGYHGLDIPERDSMIRQF
jgi:hypothetical protein